MIERGPVGGAGELTAAEVTDALIKSRYASGFGTIAGLVNLLNVALAAKAPQGVPDAAVIGADGLGVATGVNPLANLQRGDWPRGNEPFPNEMEREIIAAAPPAPSGADAEFDERCYFCDKPLVNGEICVHKEATPEVIEATNILMGVEFCDHFCCGLPANLCRAVRLADALREAAAPKPAPAKEEN